MRPHRRGEFVQYKDHQATVERLEQERDLAIAHDQQPYPTADAYEKVCAARTKWHDRATQLQAVIDRAVEELERRVQIEEDAGFLSRGAAYHAAAHFLRSNQPSDPEAGS
jgi:hypothetical protein